jgi:cobalt-zinc-cadmium efflux system outer membrane protein
MRKALLAFALLAAPAQAQDTGLPSKSDVLAALAVTPSVEAALSRTDAARAEAEGLASGPHEFTLTSSYLSRTVNDSAGVGNGRFDEFEAQITRPVRLPGKAALDRKIGQQGVVYAENMAGDSIHQAALRLAQGWWTWLSAAQLAAVDRQAVENYSALLASVKRRVALRDASALEEAQASAALDMARAQAEASQGREKVAQVRLAAQFPKLPLPATVPPVPVPELPAGGLESLRERILGRSHEIAAAIALSQQAEAQAERAAKEKQGDPAFGLKVFSEKGGMEKGAGVVFSIPFGGGYRTAMADRASAQASAAQADLRAVRRDIEETADTDLAEAKSALSAWRLTRAALDAQMSALQKVRRGQQLGELGLAEVLLAERMMHEAFRAEAGARTQALQAITRIRIDAHELWIGDQADTQ